jgi:hypothetical protein
MKSDLDDRVWKEQVRQELDRLLLTIQSRCTDRTTFFATVIAASVNTLLKDEKS